MYSNRCASSNAHKLTLSYGSILNTNLGHELGHEIGQSNVELRQSQSAIELGPELGRSNLGHELGHEFGQLNVELNQSDINSTGSSEASSGGSSVKVEPAEPPFGEPPDEPPDINLMFCFDSIPNVADSCFCPDTNTFPTINLDNLGFGDIYEKLGIDPGNDLGVTASFDLNVSHGAEIYVCSTVTGIDDE